MLPLYLLSKCIKAKKRLVKIIAYRPPEQHRLFESTQQAAYPLRLSSWVAPRFYDFPSLAILFASFKSIRARCPCFSKRCSRFEPFKSVKGLPRANS